MMRFNDFSPVLFMHFTTPNFPLYQTAALLCLISFQDLRHLPLCQSGREGGGVTRTKGKKTRGPFHHFDSQDISTRHQFVHILDEYIHDSTRAAV